MYNLPFFAGYEPVDKAVLYGLTGGIPEYLSKIDPQKNVQENIINLFLAPSGHFFEEPSASEMIDKLKKPKMFRY